jgi:hypothetical protein
VIGQLAHENGGLRFADPAYKARAWIALYSRSSKKAASLFYGRPTARIALGRQPPSDDFPTVFVLASPSGAASGAWSLQPWQELADHVSGAEPSRHWSVMGSD